jgi:serine/threonine-protein kinase
MLAGRPPHLGRTLEAILVAICTQTAPDVRVFRKDTPPALAAAVARALAREPRDRFANAAEFLDALTTGGSGEPARRGVSRTFVAGLFAALLGFGATALLVARRPAPDTLAPEPSASAAFTPHAGRTRPGPPSARPRCGELRSAAGERAARRVTAAEPPERHPQAVERARAQGQVPRRRRRELAGAQHARAVIEFSRASRCSACARAPD